MSDFKLRPIADALANKPESQWLIKHHFESKSLGMIFGAPASAKSFIAMDIAFCVSAGIDWNGNSTTQGDVIYLAGEGHNGMSKRFKVLELKYGCLATNLYLSEIPACLTDRENAEAVYKSIKKITSKPTLIIIDTLHRNFGSGDENSAKDFGEFLYIITRLINATTASVLLIHHSGHGDSNRGRGSSSIKAALDVEYRVTKSNDIVKMECSKSKDFPPPQTLVFNLVSKTIPSWLDDDGNEMESAILESTTFTAPTRKPLLSQKDKLILEALNTANSKSNQLKSTYLKHPELKDKLFSDISDWRKESYILLDKDNCSPNKPATNRQSFLRAKTKLLEFGVIEMAGDFFWIKEINP